MELCILCDTALDLKETVQVTRGLDSLTAASKQRGDDKFQKWIGKTVLTVHVECRQKYTNKKSIEFLVKRKQEAEANASKFSPVKKRLRSEENFDIKKQCLFCCKECTEEFERKKRADLRLKVNKVRTLEFKTTLLKKIENRDDGWAKKVRARVVNSFDLVAEEATYHSECMAKFYHGYYSDLPDTDANNLSLDEELKKVFSYIETHNDYQFSLEELMKLVCINISEKTLKSKLRKKFGERIVITNLPRLKTVVSLRETSEKILREAWYAEKCEKEGDERLRIVRMAASIIKEDIILKTSDSDYFYPAPSEMMSETEKKIPESLNIFLNDVIVKGKKGDASSWRRKSQVG
ncbi:unnamed protein product [Bemisia tabaci]|uniref:Uncharacterized protein n=1 Tax=Bemisia tabaci TaxID=7038 RepID=A0A9P0A047_BEMTA|nr:unnamed protein product [Bemisia tabaci]